MLKSSSNAVMPRNYNDIVFHQYKNVTVFRHNSFDGKSNFSPFFYTIPDNGDSGINESLFDVRELPGYKPSDETDKRAAISAIEDAIDNYLLPSQIIRTNQICNAVVDLLTNPAPYNIGPVEEQIWFSTNSVSETLEASPIRVIDRQELIHACANSPKFELKNGGSRIRLSQQ